MRCLYLILLLLFLSITSVDAQRITSKTGRADLPYVVKFVRPQYPYVARLNELDGQGLFRLHIDRETGNVLSVTIAKSTTHKILDDAAIKAFRKWRFQPHTLDGANIPVTFTIQGQRLSEARRLAVYAPSPERLLTSRVWRGTFRFIVDYETGKVIDVKVIRSTGRRNFDQAILKAYRQWRFLPRKIRSIDTTVGVGP